MKSHIQISTCTLIIIPVSTDGKFIWHFLCALPVYHKFSHLQCAFQSTYCFLPWAGWHAGNKGMTSCDTNLSDCKIFVRIICPFIGFTWLFLHFQPSVVSCPGCVRYDHKKLIYSISSLLPSIVWISCFLMTFLTWAAKKTYNLSTKSIYVYFCLPSVLTVLLEAKAGWRATFKSNPGQAEPITQALTTCPTQTSRLNIPTQKENLECPLAVITIISSMAFLQKALNLTARVLSAVCDQAVLLVNRMIFTFLSLGL